MPPRPPAQTAPRMERRADHPGALPVDPPPRPERHDRTPQVPHLRDGPRRPAPLTEREFVSNDLSGFPIYSIICFNMSMAYTQGSYREVLAAAVSTPASHPA